MRSRRPQGEYHAGIDPRNCARIAAMLMLVYTSLALGGCSLSMHLTSFKAEAEHTGSIAPAITSLASELDEEDWRRAQAALSLAVDPQGSGQPVNWDNPGTNRRGHFVQSGQVALTETTICRPFQAMLADPRNPERHYDGRACRLGPGEWTIQDIVPRATSPAATASATEQKLPPRSSPLLPAQRPQSRE